MAVALTTGDHVRVKATGEIVVVDGVSELAGTSFLLVSKYGQMAGALQAHHEQRPMRREEVTRVMAVVKWVDDE